MSSRLDADCRCKPAYTVRARCLDIVVFAGAHEQIRTADRLLTMQVLYRLSYVGPKSLSSAKLERETGLEPATLSLEG